MRPFVLFALALSLVTLPPPLPAQDFRPGGPTDGGVRAVCDPPAAQHIRNVGGSDGAGLCVFTAAELASRWQSSALDGFQTWMRRRPGGGWPEKLEEMLSQFCRETRRTIPEYVQHTGGDEDFLDLAMKTGRMPCVTYAGRDDFYRSRIAHMVNLAHLDESRAAIIDNNRPGVWVWMSRRDFLSRWRDMNGGWAVVFLDPPPPPYAADRPQAFGQWCPPGGWGVGPAAGPVAQPFQPLPAVPPAAVAYPDEYNRAVEHVLKGNRVMLVVGEAPEWFRDLKPYVKVFRSPSFAAVLDGVYSCWRQDNEAKMRRVASVEAADAAVGAEPENYGIETQKIHSGKKWFVNGAECDKADAMRAVAGDALADDSERWFLVFVGDPDARGPFLAAAKLLPPELSARVHVKAYSPADWQVAQFALPAGVSVRKAAKGRVGEEAGRLVGDPSPDALKRFVADCLNPPPRPMPAPGPQPEPPAPVPGPAPLEIPTWALALAAALVTYLLTRRK